MYVGLLVRAGKFEPALGDFVCHSAYRSIRTLPLQIIHRRSWFLAPAAYDELSI